MGRDFEFRMNFYILKNSVEMMLQECLTEPMYFDQIKDVTELYALINDVDYDDDQVVKVTYCNGQFIIIPE